jgi:uncharacterized membrane protein
MGVHITRREYWCLYCTTAAVVIVAVVLVVLVSRGRGVKRPIGDALFKLA